MGILSNAKVGEVYQDAVGNIWQVFDHEYCRVVMHRLVPKAPGLFEYFDLDGKATYPVEHRPPIVARMRLVDADAPDAQSAQADDLTIRDKFAMAALAAMAGVWEGWEDEEFAEAAYNTADAMLAVRGAK